MFDKTRDYWHTAVTDLRYQSVYVLVWRAFKKLFSPLIKIDYQILYEIELVDTFVALNSRIECTIEQANETDIDNIIDMQMRLLPPDTVAALSDADEMQYALMCRARANARSEYVRAMAAGERCFIARVNGEIAHSNWLRFHDSGWMDGRSVALLPGEVYSTDGFTSEKWRGLRLHEAVATYQLCVARDQYGCRLAYTITDATKAASRRALRHIGWRRRGAVLYLTPRLLRRLWMYRLGGDVEPMFRYAEEQVSRN